MQAIVTKYIGPTNFKGSRVKAICESGISITVGWSSDLDPGKNHANAAKLLALRMKWYGELVGGWTKDGMAFVFVSNRRESGANWPEDRIDVSPFEGQVKS